MSVEDGQLVAMMNEVRFVLFAESPTQFFAKTTDFQVVFPSTENPQQLTWSVGEGANTARRAK